MNQLQVEIQESAQTSFGALFAGQRVYKPTFANQIGPLRPHFSFALDISASRETAALLHPPSQIQQSHTVRGCLQKTQRAFTCQVK